MLRTRRIYVSPKELKQQLWKQKKYGVMGDLPISFEVNRGFDPGLTKAKIRKLGFASFPLSTQCLGLRGKTGWL